MGFRENLKSELQFADMLVKELAAQSGVKKTSLDKYLDARNQMPSADKAVQIAKVLGVTVEYLVTGKNPPEKTAASIIAPEIRQLIRSIEDLPKEKQRIVIENALSLAKIIQG